MSLDNAARPLITIDHMPMASALESIMERVVIDDHLHLPDMFSITLRDADRDVLSRSRVSIGSEVRISGQAMGQTFESLLIAGEVTALEGEYEEDGARLVIRGYDHSHRLVAGRRTETYRDVTDADIGRTIADRAGVRVGQIDETSTSHEHISQANQSDWEFLAGRAREIGYDMGVADGELYFRRPSEASDGPGGGLGGLSLPGDPLALEMGTNLLSFYPRVTAAQQVREVEVRGWDVAQKEAVVGTAPAETSSVDLDDTPADLADVSGHDRWVVTGRPLQDQAAVDDAAVAEAERVASGFAEAEGVARGHPDLKAGSAISVDGVAEPFTGRYTLSHTRHVFDSEGYRTHFIVSGRQDRSLLGLTSMGAGNGSAGSQALPGLAVAIVTDNADPEDMGRVKLRFPTLDENYESDWARVSQLGAGPDSGAVFLPEVNDEVLVGFESGDIRRPYIVGGLWNGQDMPRLGDSLFSEGRVLRRGLISRLGHRLVFLDDDDASGASLISGDDSLRLALKQSESTITVHSDGTIAITSGGEVTIESDADISVTASGSLKLEGQGGVSISSSGTVDIDGAMIELN
jgi:phage protein D